MRLTKIFIDFFNNKKSSGFILLCCTLTSLLLSNYLIGESYMNFWHYEVGYDTEHFHFNHSLEQWINEGLMTVFFLVVGLEIEREIYAGELNPISKSILPITAAFGGMIMPALLFTLINLGLDTQVGFGIPMATDIAFAIALLSLLGKKIPNAIKVLLTSVAIIDDLGSIVVIALFYGKGIDWVYLSFAMNIAGLMLVFNYFKVRFLAIYLGLGLIMWFCMLNSGIHASITGVFLAFAIPFENGHPHSPSNTLHHYLDIPVSYVILPIFTLANTALIINIQSFSSILDYHTMGILVGLLIGKPIGILGAVFLAQKLKLAKIPRGITYYHILGMGFLAGIGFTMSIFITLLAFKDAALVQDSKIMILISSTLAGLIGYLILNNFKRFRLNFKKKELSKKYHLQKILNSSHNQ